MDLILLLLAACWMVVLAVVVALCAAARLGDLQDERGPDLQSARALRETGWQGAAEQIVLSAAADARRDGGGDLGRRAVGAGGATG
jgi:hypothetical protein